MSFATEARAHKALDDYVDQHAERFLSDLAGLIAIPSVAASPSALRDAAAFVAERARASGVDARVDAAAGAPIVYGSSPPHDGAAVLVYGHYDVFPADDGDLWDGDPFVATARGDRIYGRGAGDNKGQLLAHLHALETCGEVLGEVPTTVRVLFEGQEEVGSPDLAGFAVRHRDDLRADLCYYSDGPMFPGDQPVMVFGARGAVCMELVARGPHRDLHSGNFGGVAPNPALRLCHAVAALADATGRFHSAGASGAEPSVDAADLDTVARLPFDGDRVVAEIGAPPTCSLAARPFYERLMLRSAFNVSGLCGGNQGREFKPIIPTEARAKVDVRLVPGQEPDDVVEAIRAALRRLHLDVDVVVLSSQPASRTPLDHPMAALVREAISRGFGRAPVAVPSLGATTPDYVFTRLLEMPSINVPYAPYDERNHAPNESTKRSSYLGGIKTTAHLLVALAGARAGAGRAPFAGKEAP